MVLPNNHRGIVFIAPSEGPNHTFYLSRITGAPLRITSFFAPIGESTDLYQQTFSRLLSTQCKSLLSWIDIAYTDKGLFNIIVQNSTGMSLLAFWNIYRKVDGQESIFRVLRLLISFSLIIQARIKSQLLENIIFRLPVCNDLIVGNDGFLRLRIDPLALSQQLLLVARPEGNLPQTFIARIIFQLLGVADKPTSTAIDAMFSTFRYHNLSDRSFYFFKDLCLDPPTISLRVANSCSYLTPYPDPTKIRLSLLKASPIVQSVQIAESVISFEDTIEVLSTYSDLNPRLKQAEFRGLLFTAEAYAWKIPVGSLAQAYLYGKSLLIMEETLSLALKRGDYGILAGTAHVFRSSRLGLTSLMLELLKRADPDASQQSFVLTVENKQSLWTTSAFGYTALMFAVITRNKTMVERILPHEASVRNTSGHTALDIAVQLKLKPIISILSRYVPTYDTLGNTALHTLVQANNEDVEEVRRNIFLSQLANNANQYAILLAYQLHKYKLISVLAQSEGRLLHQASVIHKGLIFSKLSILQMAVLKEDTRAVSILKEYSHSVFTDHGYTALMFAAEKGHVEIVLELAQAESRQLNADGRTALILAIRAGHLKVVEVLAAYEIKILDGNGWSPLEQAVRRNRVDMIEVLAPHEAKSFGVNAIDAADSSAFIAYNERRVIKELIRKYM